VSLTSRSWLDNRSWTAVYTASNRLLVATTPTGRQSRQFFNERAQMVEACPGDLLPIRRGFDSAGRVTSVVQGEGSAAPHEHACLTALMAS